MALKHWFPGEMLRPSLAQYCHQEKNCRAQASDRPNSMQSGPTDQKHVSLGRGPVYTCLEQAFVRWRNHDECEGNDRENQGGAGDPEHRRIEPPCTKSRN